MSGSYYIVLEKEIEYWESRLKKAKIPPCAEHVHNVGTQRERKCKKHHYRLSYYNEIAGRFCQCGRSKYEFTGSLNSLNRKWIEGHLVRLREARYHC